MKPTPTVSSKSALARALGVSRQCLTHHAAQPDAPQPKPDGTHDVQQWQEFLASRLRVPAGIYSKADRRKLAALKLRLLAGQVAKVETENRTRNGQLHVAASCDARKGMALSVLFDEMVRQFGHDLVPAQKRCADEAALQRLNLDAIERFREALIRRLEVVDKTPVSKPA